MVVCYSSYRKLNAKDEVLGCGKKKDWVQMRNSNMYSPGKEGKLTKKEEMGRERGEVQCHESQGANAPKEGI